MDPRCPEGSMKFRFPDHVTTAQDGGKVVRLTHRPLLPPGNTPGTHFCQRLLRPQGHSAIGRIMSMKNSSDTIWNRLLSLMALIILDSRLFVLCIYPPSHLSCPFSFVYCILEEPGCLVSRRRGNQFHTQSFAYFNVQLSKSVVSKATAQLNEVIDSVKSHELCLRYYKWAEFSPTPLTAVVRRKKKGPQMER